ncbi:twin-arginine translocase subunit TatC [Archaeoglobus neptunius]|uniref:twin-arginine translocase subunit TatC n=1 Tax=Archaeoglobus neptunius TaxID=2798580 RepID=UPI001926DF4F
MNPPDDKELELTEHIEELRKRLLRICLAFIISISVVFYISYNFMMSFWETLVGKNPIYVFSPLEWVVIRLTFSAILSLVFLYPYIMYELYLFAKPGLYEHERKFLKTILIPSYFIFLFGLIFAYRFVVPFLYGIALTGSMEPYLSAGRTISNAIKLLLSFGIFFQIPLVMVLAEHFNIVSYKTFRDLRIPIYIVVLLFITNLSMDFTGLTQMAILVLFVVMYETGLAFLRIIQKKR